MSIINCYFLFITIFSILYLSITDEPLLLRLMEKDAIFVIIDIVSIILFYFNWQWLGVFTYIMIRSGIGIVLA